MQLQELGTATGWRLPASTTLHRVQRRQPPAGCVTIGALHLPPRGLLLNRFDLPADEVGYFAQARETAIYETLARREVLALSLSGSIGLRELLAVLTTQPLKLLDLRPHATRWPVLQSLRYASTQALAGSAQAAGYQGIVYRSAQQYAADCYAIFGPALPALRAIHRTPLIHSATSSLHRAAANAVRGSQVPLTP